MAVKGCGTLPAHPFGAVLWPTGRMPTSFLRLFGRKLRGPLTARFPVVTAEQGQADGWLAGQSCEGVDWEYFGDIER